MSSNLDIQKLYIAYFNRPADPGGLNYWVGKVAGGMTLTQVADSFSASAEYQAIFNAANRDNFELVVKLYQNMFGRTPVAQEASWWSNQITANGNVTIATIASQLSSGTTAGSADNIAIISKISAAQAFTAAVDTTEEIIAYKGTAAFASASTWLSQVTTTATLATAITPATLIAAVASSVASAPASGQTFTLTTGSDTSGILVGSGGTTSTTGNDTFNGTDTTFTLFDRIDGGAGTDTFNYVSAAAITAAAPVGATVTNIETFNIIGGATIVADTTSGFSGTTAFNVTGKAGITATAAATTDISATESDLKLNTTTQLIINGGKNVTVSSKGTTTNTTALTAATGANAEILIGATTAAAGVVNVTSSFKGADDAVAGDIFVKGGTAVNITQNTTNTTVAETNVQGAVSVVGTAATTAVSVTQDATVADSATGLGRVGKTAGAVTVTDVNAASTTAAGTITAASLKNAGAAVVNSGALATLNLGGSLVTVDAGTLGALATGANSTLALNLTGAVSAGAVTIDNDIKTLNISGNTTASTLNSLVAGGATKINVSGDAKVTLTVNTTGAVTDIVVTNSKGAAFGTAIGTGVIFTGGAGDDAVVLTDAFTRAINMGAGADKVTIGGTTIGTGGSVAGGDGIDTLVMETAQALSLDDNSTFNSKFSGFEALELSTANADTNALDLDGINGVSSVKMVAVAVTDGFAINNLASGGTIILTTTGAGTAVLTVGVKGALLGAADVFNLNLSKSGVLATGKVIAANVETVNIIAADAVSAGSAAAIHTLTLEATSATSVTVAGNNGLTLTNTGNAKITNFDASAIVANNTVNTAGVAATTDDPANLAVVFASATTTANATVTIKGGAGDDTLRGNALVDVISGNAGIDTIYADNAGNKTAFASAAVTVNAGGGGTGLASAAISFMGITINTGSIAAGAGGNTSLAEIGAAVRNAVNTDAVLSKLLVATGTTVNVIFTSLVDGTTATLPTVVVTQTSAPTFTAGTATAGTAGTVANDTIDGGAGADVIVGGGGADTITTGAGADNVFFLKAHSNLAATATITDFTFATGGSSNDKIIIGDVTSVISNKTTVQDLSSSATLAAALDAAALAATQDVGMSVFVHGGNTFVYVETTGATTTYAAGDFVVKLTGLPLAVGATIAGSGFDAV